MRLSLQRNISKRLASFPADAMANVRVSWAANVRNTRQARAACAI